MVVFLNGRFLPEAEAVVPVNDRGFMYGDGLFETLRVVNGKPFRMAQHLERMTRGADFRPGRTSLLSLLTSPGS